MAVRGLFWCRHDTGLFAMWAIASTVLVRTSYGEVWCLKKVQSSILNLGTKCSPKLVLIYFRTFLFKNEGLTQYTGRIHVMYAHK